MILRWPHSCCRGVWDRDPLRSCTSARPVWDDSFSSPVWKGISRVSSEILFLEPHSEDPAFLLPSLSSHPPADRSRAPQPLSRPTPAFRFILATGLKQKKTNTPCSVTEGGSPPRREACAALGGHSFTFNYSKSIHRSTTCASPWPEPCA